MANFGGDTVTELDASTGAFVNLLGGTALRAPEAVASNGEHVWVTDFTNSVAELNASTGALVTVLSGSSYGFDGPAAITSEGTQVWVTNEKGNSVTVFSCLVADTLPQDRLH